MALNRSWLNSLVDDDGSGNGTPWNKSTLGQFHDVIDAGTVPPAPHASIHRAGGADPLVLDTLSAPTDITTLNATTGAHGLLPKLPGTTTVFLRGDGTWASASGGAPSAHATTHKAGGTDVIRLDELAAPTDILTLNVSTATHGLAPKLPGNTTTFLRGDGTWAAAPGGIHAPTHKATGTDPVDVRTLAGFPTDTALFLRGDGVFAAPGGTGFDEVFIGPNDPGSAYELWFDTDEPAVGITVTAHATTHQVGGGDVVDVKLLGGFPGGTTTFLRADGTFAVPPGGGGGGTGDVVGPSSSVDTQVARFSGTTGKVIKASNVTIDDGGVLVAAGLGGTPLNATQLTSGIVPDARLSATVERTTNKNIANGYAGLDAGGKIVGTVVTYGTVANTACQGNDVRLSDARTPTAHASTHRSGGSDSIKLDELAAPADNTTLNASTSAHGLLAKLSGTTTTFLRGDGTWAVPPGGGGGSGNVTGPGTSTDNAIARYDGASGTLIQNSLVTVDDTGRVTVPELAGFDLGANCYVFGQNVAGGILHLGAGGVVYIDIGGTAKYNLYPLALFNTVDAACDLGTSGNRFKGLYLSGDVTAGGTVIVGGSTATSGVLRLPYNQNINWGDQATATATAAGNMVLSSANAIIFSPSWATSFLMLSNQLYPSNDAAADLGGAANRWRDLYLSGAVTAGGLGSTPLNATNLTTGTIPDARFASNVLRVSGGFPGTRSTTLCGDGTFQSRVGVIGFVIDGAGSAITTGVKGFIEVPFAGLITNVTILSVDAAATAGSIVVDVWKDTYANYQPTAADSICASAKPTLSAANKNKDGTLTGWTKQVNAGDILGFNVDSAATVTRVLVSLTIVAN